MKLIRDARDIFETDAILKDGRPVKVIQSDIYGHIKFAKEIVKTVPEAKKLTKNCTEFDISLLGTSEAVAFTTIGAIRTRIVWHMYDNGVDINITLYTKPTVFQLTTISRILKEAKKEADYVDVFIDAVKFNKDSCNWKIVLSESLKNPSEKEVFRAIQKAERKLIG